MTHGSENPLPHQESGRVFVGRQPELAELRAALERVIAGRGSVVLGGRSRRTGNAGERARKAVASRIQDAIEKIGKEHRVLARHLENAIRTGVFCSYRPDRSPVWEV